MKTVSPDTAQTMQRVRVGMTGLAMVLILIGLASAIFSSANRDEPVDAIGAPKADIVANMTDEVGNVMVAKPKADEPLAELGVAPSTASQEPVDAAAIARRIEAQREAEVRRQPEQQ
ncbi:hypothetical protein [Stakelama tenebrarum]|nr:hypothetical protein [Sphingosinithalassobacter tenebrarum]